MKRKRTDGSLMKVAVAPLTIFIDDTSGNLSKQYNMFDSYVMTPAAMSFDSRGSKNNVYFICTANKNPTAVDMLPALVDDLVELEHGIEMYSVAHKDYVLVTAPLLLMQGDNHRQSQLSMHGGSGARRCCRMCLYPKISNPNRPLRSNASEESRAAHLTRPKVLLLQINHRNYHRRTNGDLCRLANSTDSTFKQQMVKDFSFCDNGGKESLRLKPFDPTQDTPIELLHTVPLEVVKFLVVFLWKTALKTLENKTRLQQGLDRYSKCKPYSRAFRSLMKHSGSSVGRNFKQLAQILPVVLRNSLVFEDESVLGYATKCFEAVGRLSSLLHMRSMRGNLEYYLSCVKKFANDTSDACLKLDNFCIRLNIPPPLVSTQQKTHFMHHFVDNIHRFGLALHFETEHGEQFNKFIREKILLTNRHNAAKDVAFAFAKQFVIRHLISGGSFLVKIKDPNVQGAFKWVRSEVGYDIRSLLDVDFPTFKDSVILHRENADNNDYFDPLLSVIKENTAGFFVSSSDPRRFIARVCRVERDRGRIPAKYLQKYEIINYDFFKSERYFNSFRSALFPGYLTDQDNNIVLRPVGGEFLFNAGIRIVEHLDFDTPSITDPAHRLLNVHKFGTLWTLIRSNQIE
ncbi:hypothetical protein CLU79DRAFT_162200 [Phycomyces nitens]|nr:hypothetical protein CLU79DRAFT_162200 [Phycomyces nitens]